MNRDTSEDLRDHPLRLLLVGGAEVTTQDLQVALDKLDADALAARLGVREVRFVASPVRAGRMVDRVNAHWRAEPGELFTGTATFRTTTPEADALRALAAERGESVAALARRLVTDALRAHGSL